MDNTNLLLMSVFILLLASALLGLFIFIVRAMKADSRQAITRLQKVVTKIRQIDNSNDRTFKEFEMLMNKKLRTVFSQRTVRSVERGIQTDSADEEQGTQDVALQTEMGRVNSLPPLLVRPALSSDVVVPISD